MARWSRRESSSMTKKYRVKINSMRLQGLVIPGDQKGRSDNCNYNHTDSNVTPQPQGLDSDQQLPLRNSELTLELCWEGPTTIKDKKKKKKSSSGGFNLLPWIMKPQHQKIRNVSTQLIRTRNDNIQFNDEFESICSFTPVNDPRDPIRFDQWLVSFRLFLSCEGEELETSIQVKDKRREKKQTTRREIGEATVDLRDVLLKLENQKQIEIEHMVHLQLESDHHHDDGIAHADADADADASTKQQPTTIGSLSMIISFTEEPDSSTSSSSSTSTSFSQPHSRSTSTESLDLDRSQIYNNITTTTTNTHPSSSIMRRAKSLAGGKRKKLKKKKGKSASVASSETDSSGSDDKKSGFNWIWKRKGDSFKRVKTQDPPQPSSIPPQEVIIRNTPGVWLEKDLTSRDGNTKLKSSIIFASFDQRGEEAAGESACAAIVAVFSHWLQSNPSTLPTGSEFDNLIIEGSSEWRKLCGDEASMQAFPDSHFDLETVIKAELRPVTILQDRSHIGFFSPEKFEFLREARSFDDIWDEIHGNGGGVYIVSWNDHFFVLKVDGQACYVMDSLGERLYEGCDQAYILKFDDSTVMYEKKKVKVVQKQEGLPKEETGKDDDDDKVGGIIKDGGEHEEEQEVMVCQGKECCREYMKRFLAAITVRDLEEREEKGNPASIFVMHQRLQIEFHYSSPTTTASSSLSTSPDKQIPIS